MVRITERELIIPALQAAAARPSRTIKTSELIPELEAKFNPTGTDGQILNDRSDTYFSQKVRNLISHRNGARSMFTKGYALYHADKESIEITDTGIDFLDSLPDYE